MIYMHSIGVANTMATYSEGLSTGVRDYHGVDREELRHQVDGDVALVFRKLSTRMPIRGTCKEFGSHALAVWVKKSGTWRCSLAACHLRVRGERDDAARLPH
jgi:ketosteroid isomerase-like protein